MICEEILKLEQDLLVFLLLLFPSKRKKAAVSTKVSITSLCASFKQFIDTHQSPKRKHQARRKFDYLEQTRKPSQINDGKGE